LVMAVVVVIVVRRWMLKRTHQGLPRKGKALRMEVDHDKT